MEREAEHVRMMDVGRLRLRYASALSAPTRKAQLLQHGNRHGLTFVASENGFEVVAPDAVQAACRAYVARRQVATDHGEKLAPHEIHAAPVEREVRLSATAHALALSPDELLLAAAHGDAVSVFEVAAILQSENPRAFQSFGSLNAQEMAWCKDAEAATLTVLTADNRAVLCDLDGGQKVVAQDATSVSWSPLGGSLAVGTTSASVVMYSRESLAVERTIEKPGCCANESFVAHHVNWVEEDLLLVGYQMYDEDGEETTALACLYDGGKCIELDELVAFFDVEERRHQYFSVFLPDWRMFFVGCSLSADIELLVFEPDEEAWQVWKPAEKYQARLPMTSDDEDTFPMGLSLDLNASEPVQVDDKPFPPAPVITCTTSEGLMISFAFIDMSVYEELEFVVKPMAFEAPVTRTAAATAKPIAQSPAEQESAAQDEVLNVPAPEDSDDSDLEEDREEERQNAIKAFDALDVDQTGELDASKFRELIEKMGTTYCEEDHDKYAKRLSGATGVIKRAVFIDWYVAWVFGEDDEEDEDNNNKDSATQPTSAAASTNPMAKFQVTEGSWRCDVCCVQNPDADAARCASCESPNPNFKGSATTAKPQASSWGTAESRLGGASTTPAASSTGTSFTFGFPPSSMGAGDASSASTTSSATSFKFGFIPPSGDSAKPATDSATPFGFNFGTPSAVATTSESATEATSPPAETKPAPSKAPDATPKPAEAKPAETESYGQNDENTFATDDDDDDDDDDDEEGRREEEERARNAFRAVLEDGETTLPLDRVPKLFKKMGSTYCEEEHDERMQKLAKDGRVHETDFAGWYVSWIFDDESSDDEEGEGNDSIGPSAEVEQMKTPEEIAAAFRKFQATEGSWKCGICMVSNPSNAAKCSACETSNPSAPKAAAKPAASTSAAAPGGIGAGGFSFPTASSGDSKTSFSFGFPSSTPAATTSSGSKPAGGFSFGFGVASSGISTPVETKPVTGGGFSFAGFGAGLTSTPSQPEVDKKPTATANVASTSGGYPPDTTTKPKPPSALGGGYPPDTTTKPKPASALGGGGYPPSTAAKPNPPSALGGGGYPPDTTTKPKPTSALGGGYPPDTTTKPKPKSALGGGGYPPSTAAKPNPPPAFGGYPPSTASKPNPPSALGGGGYPPDTTTKPKPAAFGGYPLDTTAKPKPPSALGGGYPPDTTAKPKPPAFGGAATGGAYPPDTTSKAPPPVFGAPLSSLSSSSDKPKSAFSFSSFGSALQKSDSASASGISSAAAPSPFASKFGTPSFGAASNSGSAAASPFGVAPATRFSASPAAAKPSLSLPTGGSSAFTSSSSSASAIKTSSTQRMLAFGSSDEDEKLERPAKPSTSAMSASSDDRVALPASAFEGKLWTIISDFDKALKRVDKSSSTLETKDEKATAGFLKKLAALRETLAALCDEVNTLDASRDEIEKSVLFVVGRDGDVHEQLEYAREILASFDDKALKKSLEEQPLDDRSRETREALMDKFQEVEKCCAELENHLATSSKVNAHGVASSAHLFRVLKQTYENSKQQYNRVCLLAEQVDKLSLRSEQAPLSSSRVAKAATNASLSKEEVVEMLSDGEARSQAVRKHFLALCDNSVTPRDVFKVERPKAKASTPGSSSSASTAPLRAKASIKLMPKAQMTIASPMSSATTTSAGSVSFKQAAVKSGSRLFPLAEDKTTKPPPSFTSTSQPTKPSVPVSTSNKRPNLSTPAPAAASAEKKSPSSASSFPKSSMPAASKPSATSGSAPPLQFSGSKSAFSLDPKPPTGPQSPFSLGGKEPLAKPAFAAGWSVKTEKTALTAAETSSAKPFGPDYKALLSKFYEEHNAAKLPQVDKLVKDFAGREKAMFQRLFTSYVPGSTDADVDRYLEGGPVPKKPVASASATAPAAASPFATATSKPAATPFGAVPTTTAKPTRSFGFNAFGSAVQATAPSQSPFSGPQATPGVDYKQKLVEFYQKHNPSRLSTVDATLAKYKGQEAKLFQNLATKYNVAVDALGNAASSQAQPPSTPVLQGIKANPSASPFGNTNAFAAINKPAQSQPSASPFGGGASPGGFGANAAAASPFGVATSQPAASGSFGTLSTPGFGSSSGFGGGFGTSGSTMTAAPAFGAPAQLGGASGGFSASNHRDRLVAFYQQHNPEKLNSVDATLAKYQGQEDRLFAMLEQKYLKKPAAPDPAGFGGIQTSNAFGRGFGAPATLGAATAAPAFGSASALGGPAPAFGAAPAFGSASSLGGASSFGTPAAFGAPAAAPTAGAPAGGGFSSFGSQTAGFASFGAGNAAAGGGFAGAAAGGGGGFGGGGFGGAAGGFGQQQQPAAFGNPSFTQMR